MLDLGVIKPGSTIRVPFASFDKDDGSAITMTNYAAADILIYKDGGTTERASTAGFTATTDFDGKTGKHLAVIDLADNTTAGFYTAGSEYLVAIDSVTIDGVTTGGWIARFRIGYPDADLNTTIASLSSQTSFTLTTGPAEDDALNGCVVAIHDIASAVQMGYAVVSDYTGSTKTVTLTAGVTFTAAAGDNIAIFPPGNARWFAALLGSKLPLAPTTAGRDLDVSAGGEAGIDWANIGSPTTAVNLSGTNIDVDQVVASVSGNVGGNVVGSVGTVNALANNVITAAATAADFTTEVTSGLATAAELAKVPKSDGTATWNATALASIQSEANDALVAYDPPTKAELDAAVANVSVDEIQATALADLFNTDSGTTYASAVAGSVVKEIADNAGGSSLTAADIADAVWDEAQADHVGAGTFGEVATEVAAILVDTGTTLQAELDGIQADTEDIQSRLPAALVGGRIDATVDGTGMEAGAVTAIQSGLATSAALATVDTVVDAIKAVTDALPDAGALTSIAQASALATVDTVVDGIKVNTDKFANLPVLTAGGTGGQGYGAP